MATLNYKDRHNNKMSVLNVPVEIAQALILNKNQFKKINRSWLRNEEANVVFDCCCSEKVDYLIWSRFSK
jgi:hypothetical protein